MSSVASISGLASGIQWADMIDQIMTLESQRSLAPLTSQISAAQARTTAWTNYQSLLSTLTGATKALGSGTAFSAAQVTVGTGSGGRPLLAATASESAVPGSYAVQVESLARAEKLSGHAIDSASTALGLSGEFSLNGRRVELVAGDTLNSVRDKINAVNTGTSASRVTASVLSAGGTQRLVLTSDVAGARGIDLVDGASGVLRDLGVVEPGTVPNTTASGATQSRPVSNMTMAIAAALGVSAPPASVVRIGDRTVNVDLSVDTLASIAARIQSAGVPARVVDETVDGRTAQRLVVEATVGTVTPSGAETPEELAAIAAGGRTLEVLGLVQPGRGAVAQTAASEALTVGGSAATSAARLADLVVGAQPAGIAEGDTITIRGTRGDGAAVLQSFTVGADDTLDTLLTRVSDAFGAAGGRAATASLGGDGALRLTDAVGGESQLSLAVTVGRDGVERAALGHIDVEAVGRSRVVTAGSDARARIDGVLVTSDTNTISGAIAGVTLNLQQAEPGTSVTVSVARNTDAAVLAVQNFATAFNAVSAFVEQQTVARGALAANGTLRGSLASLKQSLLTGQAGLPTGAAYTRGALVGVAFSRTGTLEVDAPALRAALASNATDVRALFATAGSADSAALGFVGGGAAQPGAYAVEVTALPTAASRTGSGFGGSYVLSGPADTLRVTDPSTGRVASVALQDGDTTDAIVERLNAELRATGVPATATNEAGQLRLVHGSYGSAARLTIEHVPGTAGNADQLGIAASVAGTDIAGTIGGLAATGSGWQLTGATVEGETNPARGLAVSYSGATLGAAGTVSYALGVGGSLQQVLDRMTRSGDGTIAVQTGSATSSIGALQRRADDVQARLDRRRTALTAQFTAMEAALSRIQSQGNWLTQQISSLNKDG